MRRLWILSLLVLPGIARAQKLDQGRALAPDGSIKVFALGGSVRVSGWERDSVAVRGSVAGGPHRFHMGGTRSALKMYVEDDMPRSLESHLEIWVPAGSKVWVKTESASIDVRGVTGSVDLNSVTGKIRVTGTLRDLYAEAMDADIELSATAPALRAKTASGAITLTGGGDNVRLTSVSGSLRVRASGLERSRFETVTGDILFTGDLSRGTSSAFESHSGRVELTLPRTVSADFDVSTFGGPIENRLTLVRPKTSQKGRTRTLAFAAGEGGAEVQIRNFKGPVIIRAQ
jgi:hypothetical protein